ncbi:hypothetical protein H5410_031318, partial [Solanum commersonii]
IQHYAMMAYGFQKHNAFCPSLMHANNYLLGNLEDWPDLCLSIENCMPKISNKIVNWFKPNFHFLKLYVDGFSKGNTSRVGGGRILRDHMGYMLMAYAEF